MQILAVHVVYHVEVIVLVAAAHAEVVTVDVTVVAILHALAVAITHVPAVVRGIAMDNAHRATDVVPVVVAMVHARLDAIAVVMRACTQMSEGMLNIGNG